MSAEVFRAGASQTKRTKCADQPGQPGAATRQRTIAGRQRRDKARFLRVLRTVYSLTAACQRTRTGRSTLYEWRQADPDFEQAVEGARREAVELVEATAVELAQRKDAKYHKDRALVLRGRMPKVYGQKVGVTGGEADDAPVRMEVVEKLRRLSPRSGRSCARSRLSWMETRGLAHYPWCTPGDNEGGADKADEIPAQVGAAGRGEVPSPASGATRNTSV